MFLSTKIGFLIQFYIYCQVLLSVVSTLWPYILLLFALLKMLGSGQGHEILAGVLNFVRNREQHVYRVNL